jgi:hypothetical protein
MAPSVNWLDYWSKKLRIFRDLLGCFNFLSAFASICRMRWRVTLNCCSTLPTCNPQQARP